VELNSIGYFQFNNLIQSRVPMILLVIENIDLKPWYNSIIQMHLENISIHCQSSEALFRVQEKNMPKNFAVVILDYEGVEGSELAHLIEKEGYLNTYFVKGGFKGLEEERQKLK
jgi:hypothetical protein